MAEEQKDELKEQLAKSLAFLKVGAKNFLNLKGIARDLNIASQNIQQLVVAIGGKPRKSGETDMHILTPDQVDKKLEVDVAKATPDAIDKEGGLGASIVSNIKRKAKEKAKEKYGKVKEKVKEKAKAGFEKFKKTKVGGKIVGVLSPIAGKLASFAKFFSKGKIMAILGGLALLGTLVAIFWDSIVEAWNLFTESVSNIFESIKEAASNFLDTIKNLFSSETFDKILSGIKDFFKPVTDIFVNLYDKIYKFVSDKVDDIKKFFGIPIEPKKPAEIPSTTGEKTEGEVPPSAPAPASPPAQTPAAPTPTPAAPAPSPAPTPAAPAPATPPPPTAPSPAGEIKAPAGGLSGVATLQSGVDTSGLNPEFEKRLAAMAADFKAKTGKSLLITSGVRSNEKQKELYDKKVAELGGNEAAARKLVAEPMPPLGKGRGSFHLKGFALDINSKGAAGLNALAGPRTAPTGWLESYGLSRPVANEDWHVQPSGSVPTADNPANPGAPTLVADKSGKPIEVNSGKKETIGPAASPPSTGTQVAAASSDVAAGQRQQAKPSAPVMINASTTNNTKVQKNETVASSKPQNIAGMLAARAA